ncbi:transporter substrate-binding domain-containing protein [Alisedimentitalea sp. MJ-SS2]|uniref:transporter substrate-binding domain-containing protein n=1 Tax=Aliisedimentitalea sp. MJ-SS2 TaxID=3049795 RepID=UPI00290F25BB|nr:transporter substrate-binding domain-containing protein [Alisedimentitalea sp. MJ-SS2]MDU8929480.1 transporter substrate-binding domain-containing protein [Alisedimentitalea sp. MJ-SS2]
MKTRTALVLQGVVTLFLALVLPAASTAQSLTFATVDRPPFSTQTPKGFRGFSVELMQDIAAEMGREIQFQRVTQFSDMFDAIAQGKVDGAIANISITAARETAMDFSHPIFESGVQIMVPLDGGNGSSLLRALFARDLILALLAAGALLFGGGMLMWLFERNRQPYFDRPAGDALFPSFWWALNLVVNGGFEERAPQSRPGRVFAVLLVISSLFIVSIFVARITAAMTIEAISGNIDNLSDLDGRKVASTTGSTASAFLDSRGIGHQQFGNLQDMLRTFEEGKLDAVVFDGPILAWYVRNDGAAFGRLVPRNFKPENYGIALPSDSPLTEEINRALLNLRETGRYDALRIRYFGASN